MSSTALAEQLIHAVDAADSSQKLIDAVKILANSRLLAAVPKLIAALNYNNPGVAVAAVDGLIQIGKPAVTPLLELLDDYNYGARAWALRALSGIGDPRAFDLLLDTAKNDFALSVRRAAARGLGALHWEEMPIAIRPKAQSDALNVLVQVCEDPEWVVRYAAIVGLEALALAALPSQPQFSQLVLNHLGCIAQTEVELGVRARIWMAQQSLQGLDISETLPLSHSPSNPEENWRGTLERLYHRKSQERYEEQPLSEGDPRKFRELAIALTQPSEWS